jgi:hypothetical protein
MAWKFLRRLGRRHDAERVRRFEHARRAPTHVEQELVAQRIGEWKDDVYTGGGNGSVMPSLPVAGAPEELYAEFERDGQAPPDPAP